MPLVRPLPGSPYSPEGQRTVASSVMPITVCFRDASDLPNGPYLVKTSATAAEANVPSDATAQLVKVREGRWGTRAASTSTYHRAFHDSALWLCTYVQDVTERFARADLDKQLGTATAHSNATTAAALRGSALRVPPVQRTGTWDVESFVFKGAHRPGNIEPHRCPTPRRH
jgi:hypothetical protein